jgi:nucleoside-diphosphate-sugar epimerase
MGMRYGITGVAGFIGSSIAEELLANGHEVIGVDCFVDYYPKEMKLRNLEKSRSYSNFSFIEEDIVDLNISKAFEGVDVIFHQAAQAGVRASWGKDFSLYTHCNILGTQKLLEACRHEPICSTLKKVVYASSSSVYGHAETLPTTEELQVRPVSPYGVTKLAAEKLAVLYAEEFNVPTVSLRYFTVYGPRQRPDMAFHKFIRAGLTNQAIQIYGDGEQSRDFTFIKDAVQANLFAAACEHSGVVCNIGGGSRVTVNQVLDMLDSILGKKLSRQYLERQAGDARHTSADTSLALELFNYKPTVSLQQGLEAEANWLESIL